MKFELIKRKAQQIGLLLLLVGTFQGAFAQEYELWEKDFELTMDNYSSLLGERKYAEGKLLFRNGIDIRFVYNSSLLDTTFLKELNASVFTGFFEFKSMLEGSGDFSEEDLVRLANVQFDLAELFARRIRRFFSETPMIWSSQRQMAQWFDKFYKKWQKANWKLMRKSKFGTDHEVLQDWNHRISEELTELEGYCYSCSLK